MLIIFRSISGNALSFAYSCVIQIKDLVRILTCRAFPLFKQSAGLFENSPFAERLNVLQGSALHPPEALPLDSAKGITSLWKPIQI